ncbi:paralemmin-3 isoform X2 [Cavia porcellus]|uniref:paralemmin-3 isoform X2 n=1 Tax=Cavia porcellus TaxID=10141 RepID=UPI00022B25E8|nr:paralemmin-3 [Cavia porcellus]
MALQSQAWAPATPMPVAESSLYRQRLEVIAEKRRLQERIRAARRELEEEKLRVQRLKRKSLRERWLMDGAAETPQQPGDPAAQDPQSPEGQAQTRIRSLEDSLFTLQAQLQLLQSASAGAQPRSPARPAWRRQGHRPLSQPAMETGPAGQADVDKRASLPVGPTGLFLESHSEPREGAPGQVPGAGGYPQEANGPCSGPSPPQEQRQSPGPGTTAEGDTAKARAGNVVEVVWEGLRGPQDCVTGATGPELEARVEQVVLEALRDRQGPGSPELPAWAQENRGVVEVVWEGLGGRDPEALGGVGPGLQERLGGEGSPDREPNRQAGPAGDAGSFIWVERVTVGEDWEELLMEGLEGPVEAGRGPRGTDGGGGGDTRVAEERGIEESAGAGEGETEGRQGIELERLQEAEQAASELGGAAGVQSAGAQLDLDIQGETAEGPPRAEPGCGQEEEAQPPRGAEAKAPLGAEEERSEGKGEGEAEAPSGPEAVGGEGSPDAGGEQGTEGEEGGEPAAPEREGREAEPLVTAGGQGLPPAEGTEGEEPSGPGTESRADEEPRVTDRTEGEGVLGAEGLPGAVDLQDGAEQREAGEGSEAGAPLGVTQELAPGLPEKQEGSLEEEGGAPQSPAEAQGAPGDAVPLVVETPAPEQPTESQPLLPLEGPGPSTSTHPAPTYAPSRQPEPGARAAAGEEASGPKPKTCQCCAVM